MSETYLCDTCSNRVIDVWLDTCLCRAYGMKHVYKRRERCPDYDEMDAGQVREVDDDT